MTVDRFRNAVMFGELLGCGLVLVIFAGMFYVAAVMVFG